MISLGGVLKKREKMYSLNDAMSTNELKKNLEKMILDKAFIRSEEEFLLSSGKKSKYLYDLKTVLLDPVGISSIAKIIWEKIRNSPVDAIGGPETGAIPIATAVMLESGDKPLRAFFVRKNPKKYGTKKWIEGNLKENDKVIIVEDVVTTGASLKKAIDIILQNKCEVLKIICIVDREEGAKEKFEQIGMNLESLFRHSELTRTYQKT